MLKGILLHGGLGTRLRPLTHTGPKQLIPIAGKPVSQWALEDLRDSGIKEVAIILGELSPERVIEYYEDGNKHNKGQGLPSHPCAYHGKQLYVAPSHTFFTGDFFKYHRYQQQGSTPCNYPYG